MSSKKLSFKMGTSGNRNIIHGTRLGPNEGQIIFDYNSTLNGENNFYPYADYQINAASATKKPSYDVKVYLDIDNENRIPLTTKFSDYSSKLWDLSTGTEFNIGDSSNPVYFSNGIPVKAKFKIETTHRATLGTTPNTFKVSIDATNNDQAIVKLPCNFGICSTAGNTVAKTATVDISGNTPFVLGNGIKVTILFQNGNTQGLSNVTLNVNNTGAKKIKIGNSSNLSTNFIKSGQICHFTYYNNYWYLDSSPEATASQNGLLSVNSQQIEGQKHFLKSVLLANGFEFRGPNAIPLASLKGSNIGNSENGLVTLTLGSIASAVDQGKGCIKLYNNETKTTTLTTYSNDTDTSNQNIYFRNYGSADNYFVTTNTPLKVGGSDNANGDKPVYISDKGVATACNGIVINELDQTFKGSKSFSSQMVLTRSANISASNQRGALRIGPSDYSSGYNLLFDRTGIQAHDSSRNSSSLNLNPNGGDIYLGPQSWITPDYDDQGDYLYIYGTIETYGDITCGGSISSGGIYPASHNQWNIGNNTERWQNIYIADYVNTGALVLGNTGSSGSQTTTIGYGTGNPETVVSSPTIGRVYFKIIS